ncbi:TetR/AcrR family transcriptional regulator [Sporosarcina sp. F6_3S_P_2]|uniref:TetR/AcrR family transcriptional regulator n=1 Tax=Sporosarcina highlanderae TaxID=3035916 RepID=A0ABT8JPJ9_9BACL|nr:TetR/AcrR family transcriptional regulator [Sporosarcina highlanderae]MDN4606496.1 TetR/AcrR family transcriptional regulator [Sporosarcina highlanderae]
MISIRKNLINAAIKQYALHGYHGATMRKIADEVGIKPPSIYFFFKNKEELFVAAFKQLLDNHFEKMELILKDNWDRPVEQIFTAMIQGIISHHKGDMEGTDAYISLVTSPVVEISKYLNNHMLRYNEWLVNILGSLLKSEYPNISSSDMDRIVEKFILIGNGVFWGIKLYDNENLKGQEVLANQIIHVLFEELNEKYIR